MTSILTKLNQLGRVVVISPPDIKVGLLKAATNAKLIPDVLWLSRETFITLMTYEEAPLTLAKAARHLNVIPAIADDMISFLPLIDLEKTYDSPRLDVLRALKKDLFDLGALILNPTTKDRLKNDPIMVLGYKAIDRFFLGLLETLKDTHQIIWPLDEPIKTSAITLDVYPNDIDEIIGLAHSIADLIHHGVTCDHIKIHSTNPKDYPLIRLIFNRFNLIANIRHGHNLASLPMAKTLFDHVWIGQTIADDIQTVHERLSTLAKQSADKASIASRCLDVIAKYAEMPGRLDDYHEVITYEMSKTTIQMPMYDQGILITDLLTADLRQEDHLFIIKANAGILPKVHQNNAYLDDNDKKILGVECSFEENRLEKTRLLGLIHTYDHIHLSYSEMNQSDELYPSFLIEDIQRPITKTVRTRTGHTPYSRSQDLLTLSKAIDDHTSYGVSSPVLKQLYGTLYKHLPKPYDNAFSPLSEQTTNALLNPIKTLSYSTLNTYFECPFKFLMAHLLKLDPYDGESLPLSLGNLFHDVLKDITDLPDTEEDLKDDLEGRLSQFINSRPNDMSAHDVFYLNHALTQLKEVILWIKAIDQASAFDVSTTEARVELSLPGKHITTLVGKIDKIKSTNPSANTFYVVDYKTGRAAYPLDYITSGLYAQLMFYLLFLSRTHDHPTFLGFYYQNVHTGVLKAEAGMSYQDLLYKAWRLDGYTINSEFAQMIDSDAMTRNTFAHYRIKKDGTPDKRSWTYDHDHLIKAINAFEALIHETIEKIESGVFPVQPKMLGGKYSDRPGCQFCSFKDICFMRIDDVQNAPKDNPLKVSESEDTDDVA
ncbi:MAG: PD-(D/E)XK nuclease family protein [Acholeplasmataceae bacterium]|nr:PD-(D/E)XK nuclease family protein [Acholeplasmataceae bacterium]